jgi:hypothetical protein
MIYDRKLHNSMHNNSMVVWQQNIPLKTVDENKNINPKSYPN